MPLAQRGTQVAKQLDLRQRRRLQLRFVTKERHVVTARFVHREPGAAHQIIEIGAVGRRARHSREGVDRKVEAVSGDRPA